MHLVLLVEEQSMEAFLQTLLPRRLRLPGDSSIDTGMEWA